MVPSCLFRVPEGGTRKERCPEGPGGSLESSGPSEEAPGHSLKLAQQAASEEVVRVWHEQPGTQPATPTSDCTSHSQADW